MSSSVIAGEEGGVFLGDAAARGMGRWPEGDGAVTPEPAFLYHASAAVFTRAFGLELIDSISRRRESLNQRDVITKPRRIKSI
jgi:hypothetical protein